MEEAKSLFRRYFAAYEELAARLGSGPPEVSADLVVEALIKAAVESANPMGTFEIRDPEGSPNPAVLPGE